MITDLKGAVLEMRREEKNLFLYKDNEALTRSNEYAVSALDIVRRYKTSLGEIMGQSEPSILIDKLAAYRSNLGHWDSASIDERQLLEDEIRALGHRIYLSVDSLSKQERKILEAAVQESQWFLLISLFIIGLAIYLVGRQLKRAALTPIKILESRLKPIAKGRFNHLQSPTADREFITFTDAFNRMLNELEIRQRRMLQSEKLASLGILASGVAHELNNPLSNISSSCQLLMEELTEADTHQLNIWLKQIDTETERGQNIVRTLLDFGGQRIFEKNSIKLLDLVDEIKIIIGKTLSQYSARLAINIPTDLMLEVDKQRIQQLFINLIQNALHAAGAGVNVRVSAMVCEKGTSMIPDGAVVAGNLTCINDDDSQFVEIIVADDGPGIPEESLPKVFDPFFTTSQPGQGVGLGLFIVQEIVREHDGCLAIASQPGKGTQVIVLLPSKDFGRG
ncbi:MAG: hypothetical protein KUF72_04085 [Candidatus Thiodiazotropha sp. (ex Ctena orbiculata)]|nr:hypothetical protein [Candidatus Thiodiazotropha taylori]